MTKSSLHYDCGGILYPAVTGLQSLGEAPPGKVVGKLYVNSTRNSRYAIRLTYQLPSAFKVEVVANGTRTAHPVREVAITQDNSLFKLVVLTLYTPVLSGDMVQVAYDRPPNIRLVDDAGNAAPSFSNQSVSNSTSHGSTLGMTVEGAPAYIKDNTELDITLRFAEDAQAVNGTTNNQIVETGATKSDFPDDMSSGAELHGHHHAPTHGRRCGGFHRGRLVLQDQQCCAL